MKKGKKLYYLPAVALTLTCFFSLIGCGPSAKSIAYKMDSQVGTLTYDQAISRWGPPIRVVGGSGVYVAVWSVEAPPNPGVTVFKFLTPFLAESLPQGYPIVSSMGHGEALRIAFDKSTRSMVDWSYRRW